jgi:hypothetical protein
MQNVRLIDLDSEVVENSSYPGLTKDTLSRGLLTVAACAGE